MKPSVVFINTSRGFVIDECALAEWLGKQPPAIAILDVHNPEPIPQEYPLRGLSNANLYPHVACKTKTASVNMGWVVKDIDKVLRGDTPTFLVC
jgi:phosphoglycerate dehydrogenase-like enzyme